MEFVLVWGAAQAHPWVQEGQTLILSVHCLLCTPPCKANSFFCLPYPWALLEPGEAKLERCWWFVPDMAKTYLPKGRRNRHWRKGKRKSREMEVAVSGSRWSWDINWYSPPDGCSSMSWAPRRMCRWWEENDRRLLKPSHSCAQAGACSSLAGLNSGPGDLWLQGRWMMVPVSKISICKETHIQAQYEVSW